MGFVLLGFIHPIDSWFLDKVYRKGALNTNEDLWKTMKSVDDKLKFSKHDG